MQYVLDKIWKKSADFLLGFQFLSKILNFLTD